MIIGIDFSFIILNIFIDKFDVIIEGEILC